MLQLLGMNGGECPELWNAAHSDEVRKVYSLYKEAGSDVIQTNTFQGNRIKLEEYSLGERTHELNFKAAKIAKEVMGLNGYVAASIGPIGKLFEPLGMNDASTDFESFKNNPNKAYPHRGANGVYRTLPFNDRYYTTAPAAGINASISDMARFLQALLDKEKPLLDREVQQTIFSPQVVTYLRSGYFRHWGGVGTKQYGLGWRLVDYKGRHIAYHGGFVNGYKAEIALCQQNDVGIVYLTNSPNTVASQSIPVFLNAFFEYMDNKAILVGTETLEEDPLKI